MSHKEKVRIARGMSGGFRGDKWQERKDAIAQGVKNKEAKIKKAVEAKKLLKLKNK